MDDDLIRSAEHTAYFSLEILIKSVNYWKRRCEMAEKFIDTQSRDDFDKWKEVTYDMPEM